MWCYHQLRNLDDLGTAQLFSYVKGYENTDTVFEFSMSDELQTAFDELVLETSAIEAFPFDDFANRLHNKVRACIGSESNSEAVQKYIEKAPNYPPEDTDAENSRLSEFEPAAGDGIASVDSSLDSDNLRRFVSADNSKLRYLESLTNLMSFCLREYVDFQLRSRVQRATKGKGNLDKIDEIVIFCGKVATISIYPLNTATGLQHLLSVTTVIKSFYS
ncbi:hypothetical protein N7527_005299 [Penicillium freii]|nr:hypothetical protein N7527_005299 [Penicillium freii]